MEYLAKIKDDIRLRGWAIVPVLSDGVGRSFTYSVGLKETYNSPEIIVFGLPPESACSVIVNAINFIDEFGTLKTSSELPKP